jgi:glutamate--cysteine ligase catalytic subunit
MGLLDIEGIETFTYQESKAYQRKLKKAGLVQLLYLFKKFQNEKKDFKRYPKFGFEIEGNLLKVVDNEDGTKNYQLEIDRDYLVRSESKGFNIVDEYGRWMLELIPRSPMEDFLYSGNLEKLISYIFKQARKITKPDNKYLSMTLPPKLGTLSYANYFLPGVKSDELAQKNLLSNSDYMADAMINTHPRFPTFTRNVRLRRGEKPQITAPIYPDTNTDMANVLPGETQPGKIHLDAFTFGMGMSSLQVTFGVSNLAQARWLYDQFHIFTPIWVGCSNVAGSVCIDAFPQRQAAKH